MILRLAAITPRTNSDKATLIKDFTKHYDVARCDLLVIGEITASSGQPDADFASTTRRYIAGLHRTLIKGFKWRNIIPYTPLPRSSLQKFRELTKHSKYHQHIGDLANIEDWLSLPLPSLEFPAELRAFVIETLQKETSKEGGEVRAGPSVKKQASDQATTNVQDQKAKQQLQEEQAPPKDSARREVAQKTQAECELMSQRIKTFEEAVAQQSRENSRTYSGSLRPETPPLSLTQNQTVLSRKHAQISRWEDVQPGGDVFYPIQAADSG